MKRQRSRDRSLGEAFDLAFIMREVDKRVARSGPSLRCVRCGAPLTLAMVVRTVKEMIEDGSAHTATCHCQYRKA